MIKNLKLNQKRKLNIKRQEKAIGGSNIIQVGSPVTLANDDTAIGAVIAKDGNKVYRPDLIIKFETYYEEQIKLVQEKKKNSHVSLSRVRTALTAYQISNPGSSNLYSLNSARIDFCSIPVSTGIEDD